MRHPSDENEAFLFALFGLALLWLTVIAFLGTPPTP